MNHSIIEIFECEHDRRSSNIAFLKPISFFNAILTGHEHIAPDIEFPFVVQQRVFYILLNYISLWVSVFVDFL